MLIKICGIRSPELAQRAATAGANYIGLVFHPESPRYVDIAQATCIAKAASTYGAIPVAVVVNHTAAQIREICEATNITTVQLHGAIAKSQHHLLPAHVQRIYVLSIPRQHIDDFSECDPARDFLLCDYAVAGSGKTFNWQEFTPPEKFRWLLAGGLNSSNVKEGITRLKPDGVDVSSGIENKCGEKDITLIQQFIRKVQ